MDTLLEPFTFEFFRNAMPSRPRGGPLRPRGHVRRAAGDELHRPRALARDLRRRRGELRAWRQLLRRRGALGRSSRAILIHGVARRRTIGADAAIGVVTSASFAVGIAIISVVGGFTDFESLLFGNVLGVTIADVLVVAVVALARAPWSSSATASCCSRRSTPRSRRSPACDGQDGRADRGHPRGDDHGHMYVVGVTLIAAVLVIPPVTGASSPTASIGCCGSRSRWARLRVRRGLPVVLPRLVIRRHGGAHRPRRCSRSPTRSRPCRRRRMPAAALEVHVGYAIDAASRPPRSRRRAR